VVPDSLLTLKRHRSRCLLYCAVLYAPGCIPTLVCSRRDGQLYDKARADRTTSNRNLGGLRAFGATPDTRDTARSRRRNGNKFRRMNCDGGAKSTQVGRTPFESARITLAPENFLDQQASRIQIPSTAKLARAFSFRGAVAVTSPRNVPICNYFPARPAPDRAARAGLQQT
jgi:hypothetical protein